MSEKLILLKLKKIEALHSSDDHFVRKIKANLSFFRQADKPDLILNNSAPINFSIGIEHTSVSVFKENKKGAVVRHAARELKNEIFSVTFDFMNITCFDIHPHYRDKLNLDNGKTFQKNIISAIISKGKKFGKYQRFSHNGLWIETESFVDFHPVLLHEKEVKDAIVSSPFDFFMIGNNDKTILFTKNLILRSEVNQPIEKIITIHTGVINSSTYTLLEEDQIELRVQTNTATISKNIQEEYLALTEYTFTKLRSTTLLVRVFSHSKELKVENYEIINAQKIKITAKGEHVLLSFTLNKERIIDFNFSTAGKKGEIIYLSLANSKHSLKQRELTSVVHIFIQEDNSIKHYKYVPSLKDFDSCSITEEIGRP